MSQQKKTVKKKKKDDKWLETMLMQIIQKSLKTTLDAALNDLLKDFK